MGGIKNNKKNNRLLIESIQALEWHEKYYREIGLLGFRVGWTGGVGKKKV
jgi:hypothetical protein